MVIRSWLYRAGLVALTVGLGTTTSLVSRAANFDAQEIDQKQYIAISSPFGKDSFGLIILQQLPKGKTCWKESGMSPTTVDPLLLQFDFKGSCSRFTDSNGYSIRVGGQDLGLKYSLRIVRFEGELYLLGVPAIGTQGLPILFIGRTNGDTSGFAKFNFNPGWRLARRSFQGKTVGHIYFLNDASLDDLAKVPNPTEPRANQPTNPAAAPTAATPTVTSPMSTTPGESSSTLSAPNSVPAEPLSVPGSLPTGTSTPGSGPTQSNTLTVPTMAAPVDGSGVTKPGQSSVPLTK